MRKMTHQNGPRHLSDWQWQWLLVTTVRLRDINRQAKLQLRRLNHRFAPRRDYLHTADLMAVLADQINCILDFRQEVLAPDSKTAPMVVFRLLNPRRSDEKVPAQSHSELPNLAPTLQVDPHHRQEVDELLELGQEVAELTLTRYRTQGICSKAFFSRLNRFMKAVLRQCQHLREIDWVAPSPKVMFVIDPPSVISEALTGGNDGKQ
jgi:hypothetical protein